MKKDLFFPFISSFCLLIACGLADAMNPDSTKQNVKPRKQSNARLTELLQNQLKEQKYQEAAITLRDNQNFILDGDGLTNCLNSLVYAPEDLANTILSDINQRAANPGHQLSIFIFVCQHTNISILSHYLQDQKSQTYIADNFFPPFLDRNYTTLNLTPEKKRMLIEAGFAKGYLTKNNAKKV